MIEEHLTAPRPAVDAHQQLSRRMEKLREAARRMPNALRIPLLLRIRQLERECLNSEVLSTD